MFLTQLYKLVRTHIYAFTISNIYTEIGSEKWYDTRGRSQNIIEDSRMKEHVVKAGRYSKFFPAVRTAERWKRKSA